MRSGETYFPLEVLKIQTCLLNEVLGHQPPGSGRLTAERKGVTLQSSQTLHVFKGEETTASIGNEDTVKPFIYITLNDRFGSRNLQTRLHTGQTAEPDQIQVAHLEGRYRRDVIRNGFVDDGYA